jgi:hypothetical protein
MLLQKPLSGALAYAASQLASPPGFKVQVLQPPAEQGMHLGLPKIGNF